MALHPLSELYDPEDLVWSDGHLEGGALCTNCDDIHEVDYYLIAEGSENFAAWFEDPESFADHNIKAFMLDLEFGPIDGFGELAYTRALHEKPVHGRYQYHVEGMHWRQVEPPDPEIAEMAKSMGGIATGKPRFTKVSLDIEMPCVPLGKVRRISDDLNPWEFEKLRIDGQTMHWRDALLYVAEKQLNEGEDYKL